MTAIAFDTLKLAHSLRDEAHFPAEQAEQMARVLADAFRNELATKADLNEAKAELRTEIGEVRREIAEAKAELKTEIAETRAELKSDMADINRRIDLLEADMKAEFSVVRGEMRTEIAGVRAEIAKGLHAQIKWIVGSMIGTTLAALGLGITLARLIH